MRIKGWTNEFKNVLGLVGVLACAGNQYDEIAPEFRTEKYKGETEEYNVEAKETYQGDFCVERIIILEGKNRLHTNPNHVDYVFARDISCNDSIDEYRFRGYQTRPVNMNQLEFEILNAFYRVWTEKR